MIGLTISMHFQHLKTSNLEFFLGEHAPGQTPKNRLQSVQACARPELGGIVPILRENPESRLNFSRDTIIPILNNSSHKPTSREIYFGKIVIVFVIA